MLNYNSRIIIACDFNSQAELAAFLQKFKGKKLFLKLGMQLLYQTGFKIIAALKAKGHQIFVDLKIHDIPNTAQQAIQALLKYQPDFISVHTLGSSKMLAKAKQACNNQETQIIGVTILTSHDQASLKAIGFNLPLKKIVNMLIQNAQDQGINHIVCAPQEARLVKQRGMIAITPGIRLANDASHDQKRFMSPRAAFQNQVDFIVVGRALSQNPQPLETYELIEKEYDAKSC